MAHNVETMAYAGQVPWHGLGKRVLPDLTPDQMLVEAGLDWEVAKSPTYYDSDAMDGMTIPDKFALHRVTDGQYMDTVGKNWKPLQNREAFEFFHDFVMQGDMEMHTAGSLQKGKIVWALAKIKDSYSVVDGDEMEQYLLFVNPHKRGKAIEVRSTDVRVVCNNTMDFALESSSSRRISVNHNSAWDEDYVKEMLGLAHAASAKYRETAQFLASKTSFERITMKKAPTSVLHRKHTLNLRQKILLIKSSQTQVLLMSGLKMQIALQMLFTNNLVQTLQKVHGGKHLIQLPT